MNDARSESRLLHDMQRGRPGAFEALVRPYSARLLRAILRITRNPVDAADVQQETLLAAFEHRHRFRGQSSFGTWLHRIAINCALARRRRGGRIVPLDECALAHLDHANADRGDTEPPDHPLWRAEVRAALEQAMSALPTVDRTIVWMRDVEDEAHDEIARRTGLSVGASRIRLHRAHALLRGRLSGGVGATA